MTTTVMILNKLFEFSRVEKSGFIVTLLIVAVNLILGYYDLAIGAAAGGLLFLANIVGIRFIVTLLLNPNQTKGFSIFALVIKLISLIAIVVALFIFTKLNIYGFFIGLSGVVIALIGESLRGNI